MKKNIRLGLDVKTDISKANLYSKQTKKMHSVKVAENLVKGLNLIYDKCFTKVGTLVGRGYYSNIPLGFENKTLGDLTQLEIGSRWAKNEFDNMWINLEGHVDENIDENDICFIVDIGGEGIVVDNDGKQCQAISTNANSFIYGISSFFNKTVFNNNFIRHGRVSFWIDATATGCNKQANKSRIQELSICKINREFLNLYFDFQVLIEVYNYSDSTYCKQIEDILTKLKIYNFETIQAQDAKQISNVLNQVLKNENMGDMFTFSSVGYSHINVAEDRTLNEAIRYAARIFVNQLRSIELYPEYVSGSSQAVLYKYMQVKYPSLYVRIKDAIKSGNWEVYGSSWVEFDTNLIGGESLIRQFYYAKQLFKEEFNLDPKILWLPDSAGFSPCIPQIAKQSNVNYFLTSILDENKYKIPYNTFMWKGIDGNSILANILPSTSTCNSLKVNELVNAMNDYKEKAKYSNALITYGTNVGSSCEQIERAYRLKNIKPLPRVKMEKAENFFNKADESKIKFDTYEGELYLDKNQGSYTSRYIVKWYNRKIEYLLRNYELLLVQLELVNANNPISIDELNDIWKEILTYQSHDIISGASINKVYEEMIIRYDVIYNKLKFAIGEVLQNSKQGKLLFNPNSFDYEHIYQFNDKWYKILVPQCSIVKMDQGKEIEAYYGIAGDSYIENKMYKITFKNGEIISLYDKFYNKEFVPEGDSMASYVVYQDDGDLLNLNKNYQKNKYKLKCKSMETQKNGPTVLCKIVLKGANVRVEEIISITDGVDGVAINSKVGFFAKKKMLRVNFGTNITTSECIYNTQFGHFTRSTQSIASSDKTQFEVSGQKFIDLSNGAYGVSLINDSRYGFRVKDSMISMGLVRNPKANKIDIGNFEVNMKILPHHSNMSINTYKQAYILNNPIIEGLGTKDSSLKKIVIDNENVILESVKIAQNGGAVLRIYNCSNESQNVNIKFGRRLPKKVVDIMENVVGEVKNPINMKSFELINLYFD